MKSSSVMLGVRALYFEVHTSDIARQCVSPVLREVLEIYQARAAEGADAFLGAVPDRCMRLVCILVPSGPGQFFYRHYGADLVSLSGFDMTGRYSSDFGGVVSQFFADAHRRALDEGRPVFTLYRAAHAASVQTWERLVLPLTGRDGPLIAVVAVPREFKSDFLQAVLAASPDAIAAVRTVRDSADTAVDGVVVAANDRFAHWVGLTMDELDGRRLLSLLPPSLGAPMWTRCARVIASRTPQVFEAEVRDGSPRGWFRISAVPLGDGVNLCFTDITALKAALLEAEAARDELRRQSVSDHLTSVLNRRGFDAQAAAAHDGPGGASTAIIALDVDHFKTINDLYGHSMGDEVLRTVASLLTEGVPRQGIVGRTGGEEFMVALPGASKTEAVAIAERLRVRLSKVAFASHGAVFHVTASFGVHLAMGGEPLAGAFRAADDTLYQAKRDGRNVVRFSGRAGLDGSPAVPVLTDGAIAFENFPKNPGLD